MSAPLGVWVRVARAAFGPDSPATAFLEEKVAEQGEDELVIADEGQFLYALLTMHTSGRPSADLVFVQHKGSKLCVDITCPNCREHSHWDQDFMYALRCPHCGSVLVLGSSLPIRVNDGTYEGVVQEHPEQEWLRIKREMGLDE